MLMFKLLDSLESGLLSHYFMPEINLLERVGQNVRHQCIAVISRWQSNILMTAPFDMPGKRNIINFLSTIGGTLTSAYGSDLFEMMMTWAKKMI